jgi:predicted RNA-binding protein with RPS1 domain
MTSRLPSGRLVVGEVVGHQPWGVEVRLLPPEPEVVGIVDVIDVTEARPFRPPEDYPPVGQRVQAVVLGYTPNGQLRLSARQSDVDSAREAGGSG